MLFSSSPSISRYFMSLLVNIADQTGPKINSNSRHLDSNNSLSKGKVLSHRLLEIEYIYQSRTTNRMEGYFIPRIYKWFIHITAESRTKLAEKNWQVTDETKNKEWKISKECHNQTPHPSCGIKRENRSIKEISTHKQTAYKATKSFFLRRGGVLFCPSKLPRCYICISYTADYCGFEMQENERNTYLVCFWFSHQGCWYFNGAMSYSLRHWYNPFLIK